jgi:Cof subfamily protein (haloacid dehalogenase superfamily)
MSSHQNPQAESPHHHLIRMIALDLDGTIVNENLEISDKTLETIHYLHQHTDVRVVIATGRMFTSSLAFAKKLKIQEPIIAYQGALIRNLPPDGVYESSTVIHHATIPVEVARPVLEFLNAGQYHINMYFNTPTQDILYTNDLNNHASYYSKISGATPILQKNLAEVLTDAPTKFLIIDDERIDELLTGLEQNFPGLINVCKSRHNFCEVINPTASKWTALLKLAERWGIHPDEIMAIGDHGNDHSMVSQAGLGVAMGNGSDELKAVAKFVTHPILEDGVSAAIERFVIQGRSHLKASSTPS